MKSRTILHSIARAIFSRHLTLMVIVPSALMLLGSSFAKAQTAYIGNSLIVTNGASDNGAPLVILGEYNPTGPLATASQTTTLVAGTVQNVQFYGQNYNFTLYALSYVGTGPHPNEQTFRVVAAQNFKGTNASLGIQTLPVNNFTLIGSGDLLAFAGQGPYYPQNANDAANSDATYQSPPLNTSIATPPASGATFTVGTNADLNATYNYITNLTLNQGRTYGFGVNVSETFFYPPGEIPEHFGVIDVTPTGQSGESDQNAEPSIAVGTGANAGKFAVHVFASTLNNPIYTTSGSDLTWSQTFTNSDEDATLDWSSGGSVPGGTAYLGYLEYLPNQDYLIIAAAGNSTPSAFSPLTAGTVRPTSGGTDQPWAKVVTVGGIDHIYVGFNDFNNSPKTASVRYSLNGGTTFNNVAVEKTTPGFGQDSPATRLAISANGTNVYALFMRWKTAVTPSQPLVANGVDFTGDVVLTRDDNEGVNNFGSLPGAFPNNLTTGQGTVIASSIDLPGIWGTSVGKQRLGCDADVAINPNNPEQVYVAYAQVVNGTPVIKVQYSSDGGNTFTLEYTTPVEAAKPELCVNAAGTVGMVYLAKVNLNLQLHFIKWFSGSFTPANTADRVLATFQNNSPLSTYDPYLGDYFQIKAVGNNFYGTFCASGNPLTADFPCGVYYQRDVKVGNVVNNNFTLSANGTLWSATSGGTQVANSIDPFFFYDIAPEWFIFGPKIQFIPPFIYDPGDPFSGFAHMSWPILPTNYPAVQLLSSTVLGPNADWTVASNVPIIQANGMNEALVGGSQSQQFFRLSQNVSSGQFNLTAVSDGNGSINPSGVFAVNGGQNQTFVATPSNNYSISSWYLDGAIVQSNTPSLTLSNITEGHTVLATFAPADDIAVTITGFPFSDPSTVVEPDNTNDLYYYIEVGNTGLGTVTGVTLTNLLPASVSLVSAIASQGTVASFGNVIIANIGTLSPGAIAQVTLDVVPLQAESITDTVSVACNQFEPNLANNTATDVVNVVSPVAVTNQPMSQIVASGDNATFSVGASGTPPLIYQWYYNDTNVIDGAIGSTLILSNVTANAAGSYSVQVYQIFGPEDQLQTFSDDAVLTVGP